MRTGSASLTHGFDGSVFLKGYRPIHWTGRSPPNLVGSKSPILRSSTLRSPSAVRIFVPFKKQLDLHRAGGQANAVVVLARTTDPKMAPIAIMLRRVRREVRSASFTSGVKIVLLFSRNFIGDYFCALVKSFHKGE